MGPKHSAGRLATVVIAILALALAIIAAGTSASHAARLGEFLAKVQPGDLFPGADRFGELAGDPPMAPVWRGQELAGYAYLNSDVTSAIGYSGKPIHIVVGIEASGVLRGFKVVEHHEPIVLIGIPEKKVVDALNVLVGRDLGRVADGADRPPQVDIVSGATVTVLVMGDSVVRSAVRLIRSGRLGGGASARPAAPKTERRTVDRSKSEIRDWESLVGDGSVRSLRLNVGEVSDAFARAGEAAAAARPESSDPNESFIQLYMAPVSIPSIGRSLLGEAGYERLARKLGTDRQAIVVAGDGLYSFKGSGYVRGGIFDRIELLQDGQGVRFRDRDHTRLATLAADGAPRLKEIALFVVPNDFAFDVLEPWDLQLLVQRAWGVRDKATLPFTLSYTLPAQYVKVEAVPAAASAPEAVAPKASAPGVSTPEASPAKEAAPARQLDEAEPLWMQMWRMNSAQIVITSIALLVLTVIFFFQDWLTRRPQLLMWTRGIYLAFVLVWLGWYANAQLSVVNVLTFVNALVSDFHWEFFLAAPLIFILWASVAAGLLFWGRGPFCGWLCPFGALQEFVNMAGKRLGVPQVRVPFWLHERLWPIKYMIFLGLFGLSLYSMALAEMFAEIEPFKTAIVLKFAREWPFVIFALTLLSIGLFIERFYCRYLCPLGAALAIPGRIRMFEWLKRWPECGSPCQRCANECPVQSIHPEGPINVNECIYCMHCQELYQDDHRCPHMIQVRLKREKFQRLSTPPAGSKGPAEVVVTHNGVPVAKPASPTRPVS